MSEVPTELLVKEFEARAVTVHRLANEGEYVIGQLVEETVVDDPRTGEKREAVVLATLDGRRVVVMKTANISRTLKLFKPQPGDYIFIRFDRMAETRDGRKFKMYTVAVMKPNEFQEVMAKLRGARAQEQPRTQAEPPKQAAEEKRQEQQKRAQAGDDVVKFVMMLMEFYKEMPYSDLVKRLQFRGFNVTVEALKEAMSSQLEFDDEKKVVRKRATEGAKA